VIRFEVTLLRCSENNPYDYSSVDCEDDFCKVLELGIPESA